MTAIATVDPVSDSMTSRELQFAALNLVSLPVWIFDIDHRRVHWANNAALQVWQAPSVEELCGRDMGLDMSQSVARRLAQYQSDFKTHAAAFNEQWTLYPGGVPVSLNVRFSGYRLGDSMAMLCEAAPSDNREPESLRSVEALLHTAMMISLYCRDGQALYRNPAARAAVIDADELLEERIADRAAYATLMTALTDHGAGTLTIAVQTPQGERWHELSARRCRDAVTGADVVLVSEADISAIKRTEARANFLAMHDSLTGLPNRSHVIAQFDRAVVDIESAGDEAALVFLDLDHFKDVNDTLGHAAGDELLVHIAARLRHATRSTDVVARLGGDEFLILMVSPTIRTEVDGVRERLMQTIAQPVHINGHEVRITPSVGVALYPRDGRDVETLLRNADLAMYTAKRRGRNELAYYDEGMSDAVRTRTVLEFELRHAFERNEFEVHYQPRVAVDSGCIIGAEALVRWRHPVRGLVHPDSFIPSCESTGLIRQLGNQVFADAARQQLAWAAAGYNIMVSVNLSARQFVHAGLLTDISRVLQETNGNPQQLEFEITESMLLGSDVALLARLSAMERMGFSFALDDFGTGYSNLAYLQRFPIKTLKIDKTFIQSLDANRPLAELIASMCKLMKLIAVAEGVETAEQLAWVASHGIEQFQGYFFAKPLPMAQFDLLLAARA